MAACTNLNRCPLKMNYLHVALILTLALSVLSPSSAATTTTDSPTTDAATTLAATTTPAPTTTTTPATTTIAPQQPPSQIPANTDIGTCVCDLTGNACDVNCCCDQDCTVDDREAFSECTPFSISVDSRLCLQQEVILLENSPYYSNVTSDSEGNLFCIYLDNRAERNFYNNPNLVETESTFNSYVQDYGSFSFEPDVQRAPTTYPDFYKAGDMIYTVFPTQAQGTLGLPKALSSTSCADANPAAFLLDESHDCVRTLTSLRTQCGNLPAIDSNTYFSDFRVVKTPALFQRYTPVNESANATTVAPPSAVDLTVVTDLYNNTYTIEVQTAVCMEISGVVSPCNASLTPPTPVWDATTNTCNDVLKGVTYIIETNGTSGVSSVTAQLVVGDVPGATQRLTQSFGTVYRTIGAPDVPFQRSGNPGYVEGQPIMAGILNQTEDENGITQEILLNGDRSQWLTLVKASPNGDCITGIDGSRVSVNFKDDLRSGCFIQVSLANLTDSCAAIQEAIITALEGDLSPNRYVAIFGNSDVLKVGDWIPILVQKRPTSSGTSVYCTLSLGMHVQVLYAYVGALVNPQPKIIGVSFLYENPQNVNFRCQGPFCQPSSSDLSQKIEVSTSVSFIDVSQPAVGYEKERPIFIAKVPYDFFYPFLDNAATSTSLDSRTLLCCVLCLLYTLFRVDT